MEYAIICWTGLTYHDKRVFSSLKYKKNTIHARISKRQLKKLDITWKNIEAVVFYLGKFLAVDLLGPLGDAQGIDLAS